MTGIMLRIILNTKDGALLNNYCFAYDSRVGQSVTLSGRQIVKHMMSQTNLQIEGEYKHNGRAIIYGDSVTGDSLIRTDIGVFEIQDLFNMGESFTEQDDKQYAVFSKLEVLGLDSHNMELSHEQVKHIMRHKTEKELFTITSDSGKVLTVTEDHSLMIDRDGFLMEVKPSKIEPNDLLITIKQDTKQSELELEWSEIVNVKSHGKVTEYVYDITIDGDNHFYFANDILVHNTDSVSADSIIKTQIDGKMVETTIEELFNAGDIKWSEGDKQYTRNDGIKVRNFDPEAKAVNMVPYNYVYRHKVSNKRQFQITTDSGKQIKVTEDHSVMVLNNNELIERKPLDIKPGDLVISIQ